MLAVRCSLFSQRVRVALTFARQNLGSGTPLTNVERPRSTPDLQLLQLLFDGTLRLQPPHHLQTESHVPSQFHRYTDWRS
jgi:hypothetical protein